MKNYLLLLLTLLVWLLIKVEVQAQNVGIGTTTPANTLEIKSSVANTSGLRFTNLTSASTQSVSNNLGLSVDANGDVILVPSSGNAWLLSGNTNATATSFLGTTNAFDLIFKVANVEYMRILNTNGNVGIGTTTPTEKLDVAGNIKFSGALMPNNTAGTTGQILTSAGLGVAPIWATIPATTVSNTIAGNNLTTTVNGITGTAVTLPATTNILGSAVNTLTSTVNGIAATAPMVNSVSNTSSVNTLSTTINGVSGTAVPIVNTINNTYSTITGSFITDVNGVASTAVLLPTNKAIGDTVRNIAWLLNGNGNATATSFLGTTNAFDLIFKTNNIEYARILNTNGNVGIGTTTPTTKLEVSQGTIKNTNNGFSVIESHSYSNTSGHPVFIGLGAGGTEAAPTYPLTGSVLSSFIGRDAIDGLTVANYGGADMYAIAAENYSATNKGTFLRFSTTLNTTNIIQERMRIEHNGNVGINTLLPAYKLHVRGDITAEDGVHARSSFNVGYSSSAVITDILEPWTDNGFKLYDGNSNSHLHIESVGSSNIQSYSTGGVAKGLLENTSYSDLYLQNRGAFVAIGTMPAVSKLTVTSDGGDGITIQSTGVDAGDLIFKEAGGFEKSRIYSNPVSGATGLIITTDLTVTGNIVASGTITPSDVRYKENIKTLNSSLLNVLKLRGVSYDMKEEFKTKGFGKGQQIGVIAQEVERIYPQLVNTGTDGYKGVDYSKFTPILIEAIKEQQQRIQTLEAQLNQLNAKFEILLKQQLNKK